MLLVVRMDVRILQVSAESVPEDSDLQKMWIQPGDRHGLCACIGSCGQFKSVALESCVLFFT